MLPLDRIDECACAGADAARVESGPALPVDAGLRIDLLHGAAGRNRGRVGGRADLSVQSSDVRRCHFESRPGQPERAKVRHVRRAVAGADAAGQDQRRRRCETGAGAKRHTTRAELVIRPQRTAAHDGRIRLLCRISIEAGAQGSGQRHAAVRVDIGLHENPRLPVRGAVGNTRTARDARPSRTGFTSNESESMTLEVHVTSDEQVLPRRDPTRCVGLHSMDRRAFRLMHDRGVRISLTALIHPLFALRVERIGGRRAIEPTGTQALETDVAEIELQVVEFGNEIAVAAEELIPTVGLVLPGGNVAGHDRACQASGSSSHARVRPSGESPCRASARQ